ncbi:MAG TPA: LuxR family transcriptional regulator [Burkholderiaceae bacterium]|jgi:LuxR family transcriptional regulator of spore coat protein|nr:LuxR family transcriptional regulator [Burkholderiaceae bacterium]
MKPLTQRELTCLQWVAIGKTSWETGRILGLAERTINFHIQNACRKLGVHGRQAAITTALRTGLLSFDDDVPPKAALPTPGSALRPLQVANTAR